MKVKLKDQFHQKLLDTLSGGDFTRELEEFTDKLDELPSFFIIGFGKRDMGGTTVSRFAAYLIKDDVEIVELR